jgi:hypothetical protein
MLEHSDYRNATYCNDRKNQRHGQKERNASHRTSIDRRLCKDGGHFSFSLSIFQDENGYYIKSALGSVIHQFHPPRDHLRASTSLLVREEAQLVEDLNSTRAKLGTAANFHYVCSGRQGTPTHLS